MKAKVKKLVPKFIDFFNLKTFAFTLLFPKQKEKAEVLADIDTENRYQRITLSVYPRFFTEDEKEQRKTLVHEFCHTVLHDLEMCAWDLRNDKAVSKSHIEHTVEATTSKLENMFDRLLSDGGELRKAYKDYLK